MKGWAKHRTFGLRAEWVDLFLRHPDNWQVVGNLGSKQVFSLYEWLKTIGLRRRDGLNRPLLAAWTALGSQSLQMWSLVWANIVYSWPVARLYVMRNYSTPISTKAMVSDYMAYTRNHAERTIYDGILELFGLFHHTPIGSPLGQGLVSPGNPRTLVRAGNQAPPITSLVQSAINLFKEQQCFSIKLDQYQLWPWTVYGCDKNYAISQLVTNSCDWLEITSDEMICRDIDKGASHVMGLLGLHRGS